MSETKNFRIKSAGRHILTIGRELIKDEYAAIVELVKNAYDADAENVKINIHKINVNKIMISVEDDGHGMTYDVITTKWLLLSTDDKLQRKISPKGRIMQGKKGIGRYAVSVLGNELQLNTTDKNGNNTIVSLDWEKFENANFIDDVEISVETKQTKEFAHTKISIIGYEKYATLWDVEKKIGHLQLELRKLISPLHNNNEKFDITLSYKGFDILSLSPQVVKIEPIEILKYFDYRISGSIKKHEVSLIYENHKKGIEESKMIDLLEQLPEVNIGKVNFDIRVYDRDKESIEYLMDRVPITEKKNFSSVTKAKAFLNEFVGVGVYRNGFRIRPLGDPGYDWLKLDERRVQNPSMCIGLNQVIGFVSIENEEESNLYEKSARDGLKENEAYHALVKLFHKVIQELEDRRFKFRRETVDKKTTRESIDTLTDTESLKKSICEVVKNENTYKQIEYLIDKDHIEKQKAIENLVLKIAIYQGQATLGKILNVVLHEGRKPLNYFSNQTGSIIKYIDSLQKNYSEEILNEIIRIMKVISENSKLLSDLFKRLDPLAAGKRDKKKLEQIADTLDNGFKIYSNILNENDIKVVTNCDKSIKLECWLNDMYVIFTNLIDNSVYWLKEAHENNNKKISVSVTEIDETIVIDFKDNGRGISEENIESGVIFDPGYTTKPNGTGLGLALAGEASERNNGKLAAYHSNEGAHFKLTFNKKVKK
jgi:signal transduction histidine kinase